MQLYNAWQAEEEEVIEPPEEDPDPLESDLLGLEVSQEI